MRRAPRPGACSSCPDSCAPGVLTAGSGELVRQDDPLLLALALHARLDWLYLAPARRVQRLAGAGEADERLQVLDRGEDQGQLAGVVLGERVLRVEPAGVHRLRAVRVRW